MKTTKYFGLIIIIHLICLTDMVQADSLIEQRIKYQKIKQLLHNNKIDIAMNLTKKIKNYPLYPDLQSYFLLKNIKNENLKNINNFFKKNPNLSQLELIKESFINVLAQRHNWKELLKFSPKKPNNLNASCNWYYAQLNYGNKKKALIGIKNLWVQSNKLPVKCKKIILIWQSIERISIDIILERLYLAMKSKNSSLVRSLIKNLYIYDTKLSLLMINLWDHPETLINYAKLKKPNNMNKKFIILAFKNLSSQNVNLARSIIPVLLKIHLNKFDKQKLQEIITWKLLESDSNNKEHNWFDNVIKRSKSVKLIERRIRFAIYRNNIYDINYWINKLPKHIQQKSEWQYWKADALIKLKFKKKGLSILKKLLFKQDFYSMVAAQRLHINYPIKIKKLSFNINNFKPYQLSRINELMYWGSNILAIHEWNNFVKKQNVITKQKLAFYANKKHWWNLSVNAIIYAKTWNNLKERFPLAWHKYYHLFTKNKNIDKEYAMSIARQESAWNPYAFSQAGAMGLMQIMPITARDIIKIYKMNILIQNNQLFNPLVNIKIGTQYLEYLYNKTGKNRILCSVAFNAGLSRLRRWKDKSNGMLDAIAFIETIPFYETRNYVKNVLVYNVYYNYLIGKSIPILTNYELHYKY